MNTVESSHSQTKEDILQSLLSEIKSIPSKYLYDATGSKLFKEITALEDYYLTRCEIEILQNIGDVLLYHLGLTDVDIIEIGPGNGSKGKILISQLIQSLPSLNYSGIDISKDALEELIEEFLDINSVRPKLILGDYFDFTNLSLESNGRKKLICFFGSSIGNLSPEESSNFLKKICQKMSQEDLLLVGFDLKKDKNILTKAYNDSKGITGKFNLNLLARLNREIGTNFNISKFEHQEYFDSSIGAMLSFLVSQEDQSVAVGNHIVHLKRGERIHTESSYKYNYQDILKLVSGTGLVSLETFIDSKKYFTCILFKKAKEPIFT